MDLIGIIVLVVIVWAGMDTLRKDSISKEQYTAIWIVLIIQYLFYKLT